MAFDPDKFIQEAGLEQQTSDFDPDEFIKQAGSQINIPTSTGAIESAISKFGQGASFGYLPQIQAATEPVIQKAMGLFLPNDPKGFNVQEAPAPTYTERRDEAIRQQEIMSKEHPYASLAGEIGGSLAGGIATGGAIGKALGIGARGATYAKRAGQAALTGGAVGLIRNPGDREGETSLIQPVERLKNLATDAATGLVIQGGVENLGKIGKILKNAPETLKSYAEIKALKASGAMLKDFRKAFGNERANEIGQAAIKEGLVGIGDDIASIASKADVLKEEIGQNISKIYDSADDVLAKASQKEMAKSVSLLGAKPKIENGFDLTGMANSLKAEIIQKYKGKAGSGAIINKMSTILDEIAQNENVGFSKMKEVRQSVDELINYSKANPEMSQIQSELKTLRTNLQNQVKDGLKVLDEKNGTKLFDEFVKENKRFSNVAEISKMANDKTARESSNAVFGLRERMASGAGAVVGGLVGQNIGGPVGAAVGAGLGAGINTISTKIARSYGTPFVALTANKVAEQLKRNPKALGVFSEPLIKAAEISPKEYVTAIELMLKKPEFKRLLENSNEGKFQRNMQ